MKSFAPCEGTSYEVGGIALIKGSRNGDNAKKFYDWLMGPVGRASAPRRIAAEPGQQDVQAGRQDPDDGWRNRSTTTSRNTAPRPSVSAFLKKWGKEVNLLPR